MYHGNLTRLEISPDWISHLTGYHTRLEISPDWKTSAVRALTCLLTPFHAMDLAGYPSPWSLTQPPPFLSHSPPLNSSQWGKSFMQTHPFFSTMIHTHKTNTNELCPLDHNPNSWISCQEQITTMDFDPWPSRTMTLRSICVFLEQISTVEHKPKTLEPLYFNPHEFPSKPPKFQARAEALSNRKPSVLKAESPKCCPSSSLFGIHPSSCTKPETKKCKVLKIHA
jgi:hypothetical protein